MNNVLVWFDKRTRLFEFVIKDRDCRTFELRLDCESTVELIKGLQATIEQNMLGKPKLKLVRDGEC